MTTTTTTPSITPSAGAMRAAHSLGYAASSKPTSSHRAAAVIDRETHAPALLEVLRRYVEADSGDDMCDQLHFDAVRLLALATKGGA